MYGNKLTVIARGMFAKQIDTSFLKTNITGIHLNDESTLDTIRIDYEILEVEKIKRNVFLLHSRLNINSKDPKILKKYNNHSFITKITTKMVSGIQQLESVKQCGYDYSYNDDLRAKRNYYCH